MFLFAAALRTNKWSQLVARSARAYTGLYVILAEKIRAKLEFFKRALRGYTRPTAVSLSLSYGYYTFSLPYLMVPLRH